METNQEKSIFELELIEEGKSNFSSIAQWAFINAIVGFVGLGVSVLSAFMVNAQIDSRLGKANSAFANTAKTGSMLTVLVTIAISLLLNIMLVGAANNLRKGLTGSDQGYFNLGIYKMATYFKILGILMIIVLAFFGLMLLIGILAGAGGAFK